MTLASHGIAGVCFIAGVVASIYAWNMFRKDQCVHSMLLLFCFVWATITIIQLSGYYVAENIEVAERVREPIWSSLGTEATPLLGSSRL